MTGRDAEDRSLPAGHDSLAFGVGPCVPGTLFALSLTGGISLRPKEGRQVLFGRNQPQVHVCVGGDDLAISRVHGTIEHRGGVWWIAAQGRSPVRLPDSRMLFAQADPAPLGEGYTPVFLPGLRGREHLLELYVAGAAGGRPGPRHDEATRGPRPWRLSEDERLVLVALARRYLMREGRPAPLTWRQVAELLEEVAPGHWTAKRTEHLVVAVRNRLSAAGVAGLTREEVGEPVGNTLNDNLIHALLLSATLIPPDLALLDPS